MHKAQIIINDKGGNVLYDQSHTAPSSWLEITREHLLLWASTMGSGLKTVDAKRNLAALLYNIPQKCFICIKKSDIRPLTNSIEFLFKKNALHAWLIPSIWRGIFKYYGPKDRLANITIQEFELCEHCYERYEQTADVAFLETLAAILYRPARFYHIDDDIRVKLTNYGYVKRAKRFKKLTAGLKYAIYLNYEGNRNFLHVKYKDVFVAGRSTGKLKKTEITPWPKIVESAANDIFGPLQATKQTNLHDFLSRLGTRIKEAKEAEERAKRK